MAITQEIFEAFLKCHEHSRLASALMFRGAQRSWRFAIRCYSFELRWASRRWRNNWSRAIVHSARSRFKDFLPVDKVLLPRAASFDSFNVASPSFSAAIAKRFTTIALHDEPDVSRDATSAWGARE